MNEKREEFMKSVKVLIDLKEAFEKSAEPKVKSKEKTVEQRVKDLEGWLKQDAIDL